MKNILNKKLLCILSGILSVCICVSSLICLAGVNASANQTITYWDGVTTTYDVTVTADDGTTSVDIAASLAKVQASMTGSGTDADPYIVTTANQLYAVVNYGGNGGVYRLANDIYLNQDYANYKNWTRGQSNLNYWVGGEKKDFHGTIDGDGHTIYGLHANGNAPYARNHTGFIPSINTSNTAGNLSGGADVVVIKNLHFKNAFVGAARWMGVIVGRAASKSGGSLTITGCSVSEFRLQTSEPRANAGGMVGVACAGTIIENCAVTNGDIATSTDASESATGGGYSAYGAIVVGCLSNLTTTGEFNQTQAENLVVKNSYSANVHFSNGRTDLVYPIGIYNDRWNAANYSNTVSALNVYTDRTVTDVPVSSTNSAVKLLVTTPGGTSAIDSASANYPIKQLSSANAIKGVAAKTAMPLLDWAFSWSATAAGYPVPEDKSDIVWDGTDTYASLDAVRNEMTGDGTAASPEIITTPNQLHAVIKYNGGGYYYKLGNDIYLNSNYKDYASWGTAAPTNAWGLYGKRNWESYAYTFEGQIDGAYHTVYGLYNSATNFVGLIPSLNDASGGEVTTNPTVVKNLTVSHSYVSGTQAVGVIIGGIKWSKAKTIALQNCAVRNCTVNTNSAADTTKQSVGGMIGLVGYATTFSNCAVSDVTVTASSSIDTSAAGFSAVGAIAGGPAAKTTTGAFNSSFAGYITIIDSYVVNVVNAAKNNAKVYPVGIYTDGTSAGHMYQAQNLYTDATTPTEHYSTTGSATGTKLKVLVTTPGGTAALDTTSSDYPIHEISASNIKGEAAKTAMPLLDWFFTWSTVDGEYPVPQNDNEPYTGEVWDGTKPATLEAAGMEGSGSKDDPFVITNGAQLYATVATEGHNYYYEIANDIYLNSDYYNYKNWGASAPDNVWLSNNKLDFLGHINGNGYTIYGLYSAGANAGLIPYMNGTPMSEKVTLTNINISNSYLKSSYRAGFILGCSYWGGSRRITIDGCTVKNGIISGVTDNGAAGGIVGQIARSTTVSNCAVIGVDIIASGTGTNYAGWDSIGSIVGATYAATNATGNFVQDQAKQAKLINCYAVDVNRITSDGTDVPYPIGIYGESITKYSYCASAQNVYTEADPTVLPSAISYESAEATTGTEIKLLISAIDGTEAIDPTSADYPIKQITASPVGDAAKTAMSDLNWCEWKEVEDGYPVPADNHTASAVAGTAATCLDSGLTDGSVCSVCGDTLVEQKTIDVLEHSYTDWTAVDGGFTRSCVNGCADVDFKVDKSAEGAHITAVADVFTASTQISVSALTSGEDYDAVMSALPSKTVNSAFWSITASLDGETVQPAGTATLELTIPDKWQSDNVVLGWLTPDGDLRQIDASVEDGTLTATVQLLGTFVLIDLNAVNYDQDINGDGIVDVNDLKLIRDLLIGLADESQKSSDVNSDSVTDIRDLINIFNKARA